MAVFIRNREEFNQEIVSMHTHEGWSIRGLARHFGISRNMVRRIIRKHHKSRNEGHDILKPVALKPAISRTSKLDRYEKKIKSLLEEYPNITGQRVFEELCNDGYKGGATIVRARLRAMRPKPQREPVIRFETEPGIQGQMDWSPYTIKFAQTGKRNVQCFSYILGFSRRQYIDFTPRRDFFTLIRRHIDAFTHFNGTPAQCLYDSESTIVLRWEAGRPVINPAFSAFITHYGIRPIICRRGRAETKGKIERPFWFVETNLLNGRTFQDIEDLRECARWWLREKSDTHIHDTTGRPPVELFHEKERDALHPLPVHPYDCGEVALRVCNSDGYIEHETNHYPVPYEHVVDILTLKATEDEILIYSPELDLIVRHQRWPNGSKHKLDSTNIHGAKTMRYGLEPVRDQFIELGDSAEEFLQGLQSMKVKNAGFHVRSILQLKRRYHCDDINRALDHACRYFAYDCKSVERILMMKAQPRTLESIRNEKASEQLRASLPQITQRPLEEYRILFNPCDTSEEIPDGNSQRPDQDIS